MSADTTTFCDSSCHYHEILPWSRPGTARIRDERRIVSHGICDGQRVCFIVEYEVVEATAVASQEIAQQGHFFQGGKDDQGKSIRRFQLDRGHVIEDDLRMMRPRIILDYLEHIGFCHEFHDAGRSLRQNLRPCLTRLRYDAQYLRPAVWEDRSIECTWEDLVPLKQLGMRKADRNGPPASLATPSVPPSPSSDEDDLLLMALKQNRCVLTQTV